MGIKGFAGWIYRKDEVGTLHTIVEGKEKKIIFVIDALSYMWTIVDKSVAFRGGEYAEMKKELRSTVEYLRRLNIEPVFVWDGPCGDAKLATSKQRSQEAVNKAVIVNEDFKDQYTDPLHSVKASSRLPCLAVFAAAAELSKLGVKSYYTQEEADSPTAYLAQSLGGYCLADDSDYFIFNTNQNCLGYIPLSTLEYGNQRSSKLSIHSTTSLAQLRFKSFSPSQIADACGLPRRLLPALASLTGNDLVNYGDEIALQVRDADHRVFWKDRDRISQFLASVQRQFLDLSTTREIEDLFSRAVKQLFRRRPIVPMSQVIDELVISFNSYKLISHTTQLENFPLNPKSRDSTTQAECRSLYKSAYNRGEFTVVLSQLLKQNICDPPYLLDDLDSESVSITVGRPIRKYIYAILDNGIGVGVNGIVMEAVRDKSTYEHIPVSVLKLQDLLELLPGSTKLTSPIILLPLKERENLLHRILLTPSTNLSKSDQSIIKSHEQSTVILALCYLRKTIPTKWTNEKIVSAIIVSVLLRNNFNELPTAFKRLTKCTGKIQSVTKSTIQSASELLTSLYWIHLLAESMLLVKSIPCGSNFYDGSMFHEMLSLSNTSIAECTILLDVKMESEVLDMVDLVLKS